MNDELGDGLLTPMRAAVPTPGVDPMLRDTAERLASAVHEGERTMPAERPLLV